MPAFPKHLEIPHHCQDDSDKCGAACAQMVLQAMGADVPNQRPLFDTALEKLSSEEKDRGWKTGPDGLAHVLNMNKPLDSTQFFVSAFGEPDAAERLICWSILQGVAAIVLWHGTAHWIVVDGFRSSAEPLSPTDSSYDIVDFDIHDPLPALDVANISPHVPGDSCSTSTSNTNLKYVDWATYFEPAFTVWLRGQLLRNKFVVVSAVPNTLDRGMEPRRSADTRTTQDGTRIAHVEAKRGTIDEIQNSGLDKRTVWRDIVGVNPEVCAPVTVQCLDSRSCYELVPLKRDDQRFGALVMVEPQSGRYRGATFASGKDVGILDLLGNRLEGCPDEEWAMNQAFGTHLDGAGVSGSLRIAEEERPYLCPTLVWCLCEESTSPFFPFYMIECGSKRVFVRIDGKVFTRLHKGLWTTRPGSDNWGQGHP